MIVMAADAIHFLISVVYDYMFAVFCEASVELGGLGLSIADTGLLSSINGAVGLIWLSLVYPILGGKVGARTACIVCFLIWVIILSLFSIS